MLVALADGSVRTIAPNISETIYWAAVTPAGGESFGGVVKSTGRAVGLHDHSARTDAQRNLTH
jgi:hypothetical protein